MARPNPFRAGVELSRSEGRPIPAPADVLVSDAAGRLVRRLALDGGPARWDGRDRAGRPVPAGVYFVRIRHAEGTDATRVVRLR